MGYLSHYYALHKNFNFLPDQRVKEVGRGKKTFVDDKMLDQNVRSTIRAVAATWRLSILGRTPPGNLM